MDDVSTLDALTVVVFGLIFTVFTCFITKHAREEHDNALERWREENESRYVDDADTGWGREEAANSMKKFTDREVVISPELGRGHVVLNSSKRSTIGRDELVVDFDILNELRVVQLKDLLFIGMRLKHAKRGLGTIDMFDFIEERAHVRFDSGEYHRYLLNSWKSKMVARARYARKNKSFERFFQDYMFYRIDYVLSNFTFAKPVLLSAMSLTLIIVGALLYALASGTRLSESTWVAWTLVASSGSQAGINQGGIVRGIAAFLTLGGMLVFALVIGLMADGVGNLLDDLKQGNALVIQTGHTLILGWSDKTIPVVRELCLANNHRAHHVVVILAERPKSEMETELLHRLSRDELGSTQVIFRSGNPSLQQELHKVSAGSARSVIILADSNLTADESDARVVRCVLSLQGVRLPMMGHIVVEMCDVDNRDLGLLADSKNVEVVVAHDLIGRLMIQSAREPGLAHVLERLLGFEAQVFSLHRFPELDGCTFGEVVFRFEDAIVVGIKPCDRYAAYQQFRNSKWRKRSLIRRDWDGTLHASSSSSQEEEEADKMRKTFYDNDAAPIIDHYDSNDDEAEGNEGRVDDENETFAFTRRVIVNPPNDYVVMPGDEIMLISTRGQAREFIVPRHKPFSLLPKSSYRSYLTMKPAHRPIVLAKPERILFCGWRRDVDDIILELDLLVCGGSQVTILCNMPVEQRLQRFQNGGMDVSKLKHLTIEHLVGDWSMRRELSQVPLTSFSSIFILADQGLEDNITRCDSKSLAALVFIREIISKRLSGMENEGDEDEPCLAVSPRHNMGSIRKFNSCGSAGSSSSMVFSSFRRPRTVSRADSMPHHSISFDGREASAPRHRISSTIESKASTLERQFSQRFLTTTTTIAAPPPNGDSATPPLSTITMDPSSLQDDGDGTFYVKRHSPVGQDLFFENKTGGTILISEILDANTKTLIPGTDGGVGDYVMSNEAVACALAMVSECRDVNVVLHELLQAEGNDLHLRSALDYGFPGEKVDFWQLQARARARAEICIGYRGYGDRAPSLNPKEKSAKFVLHPKSMVIVVSEDNGRHTPREDQQRLGECDLFAIAAEESDEEKNPQDDEDNEEEAVARQMERDHAAMLHQHYLQQQANLNKHWHLRAFTAMQNSSLLSYASVPVAASVVTALFFQRGNVFLFLLLMCAFVFLLLVRVNSRTMRHYQIEQHVPSLPRSGRRRPQRSSSSREESTRNFMHYNGFDTERSISPHNC